MLQYIIHQDTNFDLPTKGIIAVAPPLALHMANIKNKLPPLRINRMVPWQRVLILGFLYGPCYNQNSIS